MNGTRAEINLRKLGVSFAEAGRVFGDDLAITVPDPDHSKDEERYITVGWSNRRRLLMIAHTYRGERIRMFSAGELTRSERKAYEEKND